MSDDPSKYKEGGSRFPTEHPAACRVTIVDAEAGTIQLAEPRSKFALVGFSSTSRDKAPYDDPSWVIAGLNQLYRYTPRADMWFEMHAREAFVADQVEGTDYLGWLRNAPYPVFMIERSDDIPMSVRYPIEGAIDLLGRDYFHSTIAYGVAWAVLAGFQEIGLWGIDLIVGQEWDYQKPNLEYVLGIAHARGIKLTIPSESAVLKPWRERYGLKDNLNPGGIFSLKFFETVIKNGNDKRDKLVTELNQVDGALAAFHNLREAVIVYQRGGTLDLPGSTEGK